MTKLFQPSKPATRGKNIARTIFQVAVIWAITLIIIPYYIKIGEESIGILGFNFKNRIFVGLVLFMGSSLVNMLTGITMAIEGEGTPFPMTAPRKLVVAGPYQFLRNPMAVFGVIQGICIAIILGSYGVLLYTAAGAFFWNYFIRPKEEQDLEERFTAPYLHYKNNVKCWVPRMKPYKVKD